MKKIFCISGLFIFFSILSYSQQDITKDILNYEPTKSDVISKARNLLLDEFIADNTDRVEEVFLYLVNNIEDENYKPFYFPEKVILACWTRNYIIGLKEILYFDSIAQLPDHEIKKKIYPNSDLLWNKILEKSYLYKESIYDNIKNSDLNSNEKEVMHLVAMDLLENNRSIPLELKKQEEINHLSREFLDAYPHSQYDHFIRNYVRYEFRPSNWGFGYSFSLGYFTPIGYLNDFFSSSFSFGLNFDVSFKDFVLLMGYNINGGHLKKDILFDNDILWAEESKNSSIVGNVSLGYRVLDSNHFSIIPFVGFGGYSFYPVQKDSEEFPQVDKKEISYSSYAFGLKLDYKPYQSNSGLTLGLRLTYYTPIRKTNGINGDIINLTFDFGGFFRNKKRIY